MMLENHIHIMLKLCQDGIIDVQVAGLETPLRRSVSHLLRGLGHGQAALSVRSSSEIVEARRQNAAAAKNQKKNQL